MVVVTCVASLFNLQSAGTVTSCAAALGRTPSNSLVYQPFQNCQNTDISV
jgi:hypothetical protein